MSGAAKNPLKGCLPPDPNPVEPAVRLPPGRADFRVNPRHLKAYAAMPARPIIAAARLRQTCSRQRRPLRGGKPDEK